MSKNMLTNEEVGALVEAAREGRLPEGDGSHRGRARKVHTVDFSRPTKFSAEHQRRIGRSLALFAQTAGSRLSAELRIPVEVEMIGVSQLRWSSVQAEVPPSSLAMSIESRPTVAALLMCAEQSFLLCAIDCLLGTSTGRCPSASSPRCSCSSRPRGRSSRGSTSWRRASSCSMTCSRSPR
jgi:flagellar motor switch protein FliM